MWYDSSCAARLDDRSRTRSTFAKTISGSMFLDRRRVSAYRGQKNLTFVTVLSLVTRHDCRVSWSWLRPSLDSSQVDIWHLSHSGGPRHMVVKRPRTRSTTRTRQGEFPTFSTALTQAQSACVSVRVSYATGTQTLTRYCDRWTRFEEGKSRGKLGVKPWRRDATRRECNGSSRWGDFFRS